MLYLNIASFTNQEDGKQTFERITVEADSPEKAVEKILEMAGKLKNLEMAPGDHVYGGFSNSESARSISTEELWEERDKYLAAKINNRKNN